MDVKSIEQRVADLEQRLTQFESKTSSSQKNSSSTDKKLSPKEFLLSKSTKTETQKTLALGYYLEHIMIMDNFNVVDLVGVFYRAKEKSPKNINDSVNKNIRQGFLMEAKEKKNNKKTWVLTSSGEKYVESDFNKSDKHL